MPWREKALITSSSAYLFSTCSQRVKNEITESLVFFKGDDQRRNKGIVNHEEIKN